MNIKQLAFFAFSSVTAFSSANVLADYENKYSGNTYKITVTNLTKSIAFTPVLIASHKQSVDFFQLAEPASYAIERVAEGGDTSTLAEHFDSPKDQTQQTEGLLQAGQSVNLIFENVSKRSFFSAASMLLPTNDAFIALESVRAPKSWKKRSYYLRAYDSGTENNDELCVSIPGPQCGGAPFSPEDNGEGFIHVHSGIHGVGDLSSSEYSWQNPVVKITIQRIK